MKLRVLALSVVLGGTALVAGCGSKSDTLAMSGSAKNFTMDPKYTEFCGAYDSLNLSLDALAKAGSSKEAFADVLAKSNQLVDIAPTDIQSAVASNDAILNAMNNVFSQHNYDEKKVSSDEEVKKQIQALYQQEGLADLATKYADYLIKNCGISTAGK